MNMSLAELEGLTSVKHANALIESMYRMEANEQKIIILASKIVNQLGEKGIPFDAKTEIIITAAEYAKEYGIDYRAAWFAMTHAKNTIYRRTFSYLKYREDGTVKPMQGRWVHSTSVEIADSDLDDFESDFLGDMKEMHKDLVFEKEVKSEITLMFSPEVIPYIYQIKSEYTLLDIQEIGRLSNKYAIRLYKLLMKWRNAEEQPYFEYQQLRKYLGLAKTEYAETKYFNKTVLGVALKQINAGTGFIDLEAKPRKKGKSIIGYTFPYKAYENNMITVQPGNEKKPKQRGRTPKGGNQGEGYVVYRMTDSQINTFSKKLARLACESDSGFNHLGELVEQGQDDKALAAFLAKEFRSGNFAPYLADLERAEFTPNRFNKTLPEGKSGGNTGNSEGDAPQSPKQKPVKPPRFDSEGQQSLFESPEPDHSDVLDKIRISGRENKIATAMMEQASRINLPIFSDLKEKMEFTDHFQLCVEIAEDLEARNLGPYAEMLKYLRVSNKI